MVPLERIIRLTCQWVAKISGTLWGTYCIRELLSTRSANNFRLVHNFLNIYPFLKIFAPLERSQSQLSNGTNFIKHGYILRNIWRIRTEERKSIALVDDVTIDLNVQRNAQNILLGPWNHIVFNRQIFPDFSRLRSIFPGLSRFLSRL